MHSALHGRWQSTIPVSTKLIKLGNNSQYQILKCPVNPKIHILQAYGWTYNKTNKRIQFQNHPKKKTFHINGQVMNQMRLI